LLPELLELPERPLLPFLLLLPREDDPSSFMPPRWRLLSDWLRDELLPLRDELPDPDDLFDWFAIANAPQGCGMPMTGTPSAAIHVPSDAVRAEYFFVAEPLQRRGL
jgi:hypothetical protein